MDLFFEHLLKSAGILTLFLVSYHLFLKKETFFQKNRWFLLVGLVMALALPFVSFTKTVLVQLVPNVQDNGASAFDVGFISNTSTFNPLTILVCIYITGVVFLGFKLLLQILRIRSIKNSGQISEQEGFYHVRTKSQLDPFSFFRYIFYFPKQFKSDELQAVIAHEKIHAREMHSFDILLVECITILQWFNPLAWYYKWTVKQNLEFLADAKTCQEINNRKFYQYLMLKHATGKMGIAITNPFFNHIIKKRIVMMNKNQSKKMNLAKLFFVFPLLALFLWSFNTKTVYEFKDSASSVTKVAGKSIELVIDMNTTDKELKQIKNDLAEDGIDFSYTVVHNDSDEIIDISIQVSGKGENGGTFKNSYNSSDNADGISPIVVYIDLENNLVSVGTKGSYTSNVIKTKSKSNSFWINSDDDNEKEIIEIRKSGDGEEVIKLNGKVITREELEKNDKYQHISVETEYNDEDNDHSSSKKIIVKSIGSDKGGEDGEDVFIINTDKSGDFSKSVKISSNSFFFVDSDGKEKPLYYIVNPYEPGLSSGLFFCTQRIPNLKRGTKTLQ